MKARLIAALASLGVILAGALFLYGKGRTEGAARLKPRLEAAEARANVAALERSGAEAQAQRLEIVVRRQTAAAAATQDLASQLSTSEDANAALDPERVARLRAHDERLCDAAPELAGCAADRPAGNSPHAVPSGPAASGRH